MQTKNPIKESAQVLKTYIEKLSAVRVVSEILLTGTGNDRILWVVIDGTADDDDGTSMVVKADIEATRETQGKDMPDLRLIHRADYQEPDMSGVIPSTAKTVWRR